MIPNLSINPEQQQKMAATFHALFNDESADFSDRLIALKQEQTKVIEGYARDGMIVVLEYEARMYMRPEHVEGLMIWHYSNAPAECPWSDLKRLSIQKFVAEVWQNFDACFITTLQSRCTDAFVLKAAGKWYLVYAFETSHYQSGNYFDFIAGREPNPDPQFSKELTDLGWHLPADLKRFYNIHGSFGELTAVLKNETVGCIASVEEITPSLNQFDAIAKEDEWEIDYSFHNLLPFCDDGSGNSQNFYKIRERDDSYLTVSWDHDTKELGEPETLAAYMNQYFGDRMSHWG